MTIKRRDYGVNGIFILAKFSRRSRFLNEKVNHVNFLLNLICEENGHFFIDNGNIETIDFGKILYIY